MKEFIAFFVTSVFFLAIYVAPIFCIVLIKDPHRIVIIYEIVSLFFCGLIVAFQIEKYINKTLEIKD